MGCDIHSHAEKRVEGRWVHVDVEAFEDRNYGFFGWLAGVRNYSAMTPIASNRGLPHDASRKTNADYEGWSSDAHSDSWVGLDELLAVDYSQTVEDRRVTKQLAAGYWSGGETCDPGQGAPMTLQEFLGGGYFRDLKRLQDAGAERVVFWFDN
jgi:hypothetical protein